MARYLFVSPHPDDVVFSMGGLIAQLARAGHDVTVATAFHLGPDAAARDREDGDACARLGAHRVTLGFHDLIARRPASADNPAPTTDDFGLVPQLRAALMPFAVDATVVAPLGVAAHADHQIAFRACAALPGPVAFYEEMPYALCPHVATARLAQLAGRAAPLPSSARLAAARWWLARPVLAESAPRFALPVAAWIAAGLEPAPPESPIALREERHDITATVRAKMDAIARYRSQWPRFYPTLTHLRDAQAAHSRHIGSPSLVERLFRRA